MMTVSELDELFETDANNCFIRLVLPKDKLGEEINLIGKNKFDLPLDLVVRIKQYAGMLYDEALHRDDENN